jgi:hypothetical protein
MAAEPICPNPMCKSGLFTTTDYPVVGAQTLKLVHCLSCGTVVGVVDSQLADLSADVARIKAMVRDLVQPAGMPPTP